MAISGTELFRRLPEACYKPSIGLPESPPYAGAHCMEERSGRSLRMLRPIMGVLTQNRRDPQRLTSRSRGPGCGLLFDLMDQVKGAFSPDWLRKVSPAGERRQVQRLDVRVLETVEGLSPVAGGVLLGAVEPVAGEILALDQGAGGSHRMVTTARRWLRRPADRYDGSQMVTTGRRSLRRPADGYDWPQMVTTARRRLRRAADGYDGPQTVTTGRRWLRRAADGYDGSQMVTTGRRWLRRPADGYDGPQMVTSARRWLRRPADGYDGSQICTAQLA